VADVESGEEVEVMVLGVAHKATVLAAPPFDPEGIRLRA
jgi:dimethylglycine dehydrogenase